MSSTKKLMEFVRDWYQSNDFVPLHAPMFQGNEKAYLEQTIDSTFVSSVGEFVDRFEKDVAAFTGSQYAVATVNGTAALHTALHMAGVSRGDLVVTQALTFVATCDALHHLGAEPVFVDVSRRSLGLCPRALEDYLQEFAELHENHTSLKSTGQRIRAIVPMHTFGHPVELDEMRDIASKWGIVLIEDAAESLGSYYKGQHTGLVGDLSALSFNGNKIITTGGGGMVLTQNEQIAKKTKHVTTTARVSHDYEYYHDEVGFNYRMPNLNAALGCAQLEMIERYLADKRALAEAYKACLKDSEFEFVEEPDYARSNYWLNAILLKDKAQRDEVLKRTNEEGVMTRPVWQLMHRLPMYQAAPRGQLPVSEDLEARLVNIPSSPKHA